jgi:AcrR family transcriptional regulator
MSNSRTPRRQRAPRTGRTRAALLAAGHELLADRSIDALAVDDIVQTAGVAKGSFYNHFDDKQALVSTICNDIRQQIETAVDHVNAQVEDPALRVVRALAVYVSYMLASEQRANLIMRLNVGVASTANPVNAGVLRDVAAGLRSGRFILPSVVSGALFVIGTCDIALMHAVEEASTAVTITVAQQLGALMLRGLGIPIGESEALSALAIHQLVRDSQQLRAPRSA